jgi:molybdenum cofactor cytidylyltransferase
MIVGIVLAAGAGTRFGGHKVLAPLRGIPLVRHVVDRLRAGGVASVIVAAAAGRTEMQAALAGTDAVLVEVPDAAEGLSASLRRALAGLPDECTGFVVALGDQPLIDPAVVRQLRETWESSNAAAVVPVYADGERGNPVFFDVTMRRRLQALTGDQGARALLRDMGDKVGELQVHGPAPRDVDTRGDLEYLADANG